MKKYIKLLWPFIVILVIVGLYEIMGYFVIIEVLRTLVDGVFCFAVFLGFAKLYGYTIFMGRKINKP